MLEWWKRGKMSFSELKTNSYWLDLMRSSIRLQRCTGKLLDTKCKKNSKMWKMWRWQFYGLGMFLNAGVIYSSICTVVYKKLQERVIPSLVVLFSSFSLPKSYRKPIKRSSVRRFSMARKLTVEDCVPKLKE